MGCSTPRTLVQVILPLVFCLLAEIHTAQPGKDGALTIVSGTQVVNRYAPVSSTITPGTNTLTFLPGPSFSLCAGDLIMVYQAQGATISTTNTATYGDITSYNSAGLFEFKYVRGVAGNTIETQTTFTNTYHPAGKVQVIKVPQYTSLVLNANTAIVAKPWKDTTISSSAYRFGGLVVLHAASITNNGLISASYAGFRGGIVASNLSYTVGIMDFVSTVQINGGIKGEGIAGAPVDYDLMGGRYCRGAPANGGGGGTSTNSSGGGGANGNNQNVWTGHGVMIVNVPNPLAAWSLDPAYISNANALTNSSGGGRGGYSWGNANGNALSNPPGTFIWAGDNRREVGGRGGRPLTNIHPETRLYFGGGGGAGDANNNGGTSGGNGGGIIYLICTSALSGTGVIESNGFSVPLSVGCNCDGHGGGGAGGSIVIKCGSIAPALSVKCVGGLGGSQFTVTPPGLAVESEGPGGGGGGGFAAISAAGVVPDVQGGMNGSTASPGLTEFPFNGGTAGANGHTATVSSAFISYLPPQVNVTSPACVGGSVSFSVSGFGVTSYYWTGPNSFTSNVASPTVQNLGTSSGGIYTLQLVYTNSCTITNTFVVTVAPGPTISVTGLDTLCAGRSATLVASGALSHTWLPSGANADSLIVAPLVTTTYTVAGTDSLGCSHATTYMVQVAQNPTVTISAPHTTLCYGGSVALTGSGAQSYTWNPGSMTSAGVTVSPTAGGVYTLTGAGTFHCADTATVALSVYPLPALTATSSNYTVCPGEVFTVTAGGAQTFTWDPGSLTGPIQTYSVTQETTITLSGNSPHGCFGDTTIQIKLKPVPLLGFNTASITCSHLGYGTVTANGGSGSFSYTWVPTAQTGSAASGLFPGTYTIFVHDSLTGCVFSPTVHFAPLVPLAGTVIAADSVKCFGGRTANASITLSGGSGAQSYAWTDTHGIQTTPSADSLAAGINTIVVTDSVTHCTVSHTFLVLQPPAISPSVTPTTHSVCLGGQITLTATASGGIPPYTYSWIAGPVTQTLVIASPVAGNSDHTVTISDANHCEVSSSFTGSFIPNPTVTVNSLTVCPLQAGTLTAVGASTYTWSTGSNGNQLVLNPTADGQYTVTGNLSGCVASVIASVSVKSAPAASITAKQAVCENDTLVLSASGGGSYSWAGPAGFSSSLAQPSVAGVKMNHTGTYSVLVTGVNGCTAAVAAGVTVYLLPAVVAGSSTVCAGTEAVIWAGFVSGAGYSWKGPQSFTSTLQSVTFQPATASMSGVYTVEVTSADGCRAPGTSTLLVVDPPVYTIQGPGELCVGDTIFLSAPQASGYLWFAPGGVIGNSPAMMIAGLTASTTFTLLITEAPCTVKLTHPVTVHQLPVPQALSFSHSPCDSMLLLLSSSVPQFTNTWYGPQISSVPGPTLLVSHHSASSVGVYTLHVMDQHGCEGSDTLMIGISFGPPLSVRGSTVCRGQDLSLTATGAVSYQWSGPGGYSASGDHVDIVPDNSMTTAQYTVVGSDTGPCTTSAVAHVLIRNMPAPNVALEDTMIFACRRSVITLAASGASQYAWSGPADFSADSSIAVLSVDGESESGTYTVNVRNDSNCVSSRTVFVSVFPEMPVQFGFSANYRCVPFCSTVSVNGGGDALLSYSLFANGIEVPGKPGELCIHQHGPYEFMVKYTDTNLCVSGQTFELTGLEKPAADFSFHPEQPVAGIDEVSFYNGSEGAVRSLWIVGDGATTDSSLTWDYQYAFDSSGTFPVVLVVESRNGCRDTIVRPVHVTEEFTIYFPNTFTPGSDGLNDLFQPRGVGVTTFEMSIFDRWGERMYTTRDFNEGWDGTLRGRECKNDIYVWKAAVTGPNTSTKHYSGYVLLLRNK